MAVGIILSIPWMREKIYSRVDPGNEDLELDWRGSHLDPALYTFRKHEVKDTGEMELDSVGAKTGDVPEEFGAQLAALERKLRDEMTSEIERRLAAMQIELKAESAGPAPV